MILLFGCVLHNAIAMEEKTRTVEHQERTWPVSYTDTCLKWAIERNDATQVKKALQNKRLMLDAAYQRKRTAENKRFDREIEALKWDPVGDVRAAQERFHKNMAAIEAEHKRDLILKLKAFKNQSILECGKLAELVKKKPRSESSIRNEGFSNIALSIPCALLAVGLAAYGVEAPVTQITSLSLSITRLTKGLVLLNQPYDHYKERWEDENKSVQDELAVGAVTLHKEIEKLENPQQRDEQQTDEDEVKNFEEVQVIEL